MRIERLVLRGVPPSDAHALSEALRTALEQQLADRRTFKPSAVDRMDLGALRVSANAASPYIGAAVARRIAGELGR